MRNKSKVVMFISLISLPALFAFQNCAAKVQETQSSSFVNDHPSLTFETNNLGKGGPDGKASADDAALSQRVHIQIEDPEVEFRADIASAPDQCENDRHQPPTGDGKISQDGGSIDKVIGVVVLSPEDFGGRANIDKVSNIFGTVIICNLNVSNIENIRGRVIIYNSIVSVSSQDGQVGVYDNGQSTIVQSSRTVLTYKP